MRPSLVRLRAEVAAGRLSRHCLLEELDRCLEQSPHAHLEGALELVLEELHRSPDDPHALRLLARLYERNGDLEGAGRALARIAGSPPPLRQAGSVEDELSLARVLLCLGEPEEAERHVRKALAREPRSLSALSLLARICHSQGRLTETIGLWQQISLLAPSREGVLAQLGILHRLAQDEELARLPLAPVGQDLYARKSPAQVELETAFALFGERDFKGALAACDAMAHRHRGSAPELFKLAVLQKAYFQERMDDLQGARATLVQLGRQRGFETDVDRLGFLARLCERAATPETLEQALHIYEHLHLHHGKLSALPRLAALSEATGAHAQAESYLQEFDRRFSRRMHEPTENDLLRALSLRYLPLGEVRHRLGQLAPRAMRNLHLEPSFLERRRLRALLCYLSGDTDRCRRLLQRLVRGRSPGPLDFAYLGDALAASGRPEESAAAYAESLRRSGAADALVWRSLLRVLQGGVACGAAGRLLQDQTAAQLAHRELTERARRSQKPAAWRELASMERAARWPDRARAHEQRAAELERAASGQDLGRVRVAAVVSLAGKPKGLVHEMLALRRKVAPGAGGHLAQEGGILGSATAELHEIARVVLATAIDFARARWPHLAAGADGYVYSLKIAKDDEPSSGASAGLPIAVAFLSLLTGREVGARIAFSGALACDSQRQVQLRRIGDAAHKLKGAYHAGLEGILLPEENREDLERADVVPLPVARRMARFARDLDGAVVAIWGPEAWDW
ncbi:MAG: tetratricopeptide repeat protein [Myxococcales bacterium]|nr:tetratricopeptide repeat protein [Myxococcales bacterium]